MKRLLLINYATKDLLEMLTSEGIVSWSEDDEQFLVNAGFLVFHEDSFTGHRVFITGVNRDGTVETEMVAAQVVDWTEVSVAKIIT